MKIGLRTPLFIVVTAPTAAISRTPSDNLAQSRVFRRSAIRMPVRQRVKQDLSLLRAIAE
jgi:hypothetical protein